MKHLKVTFSLAVSLWLAWPVGAWAGAGADDLARAERAFAGVNDRIDRLASFQYKVVRETKTKGVTLTEKWTTCVTSQGWLRVDYTAPEKRVFLVDGISLLEYLPDARKALRTPLADQGAARLAGVMKRLAVDGLRVGKVDELLTHLKSVTPSPGESDVWVVEGDQPRYVFRIDTARHVLLGYDQWNAAGEKNLSVQADDFTEAAPGLWLPGRIRTVILDKGERVERETSLAGVRVNVTMHKDYFDFSAPDDVKIETAEASSGVSKTNTR